MQQVKIRLLTDNGRFPTRESRGAAGYDLYASHHQTIPVDEIRLVGTDIAIALPPGLEAQVRSRSGLAVNHGVIVLNAPGTIDSDYRGEIKVVLINHGAHPFKIQPGDRIAQLVIAPVIEVEFESAKTLTETERGTGGFGSTGQ